MSSGKTPLGANYYRLWSASAASNLGDGIGVVAWPWLASLITRDPIAIAVVAASLRLPWLLFSLPAGVITDRLDRRKIVMVMDLLRALFLTLVALAVFLIAPDDEINSTFILYGIVLLAALATGMAEVLRDNAAQTLMPSIVPKERLEAANGWLWSIEMLMNSLVGPPLAGFLIAISVASAFAFNAFSFALSAVLVFTLTGNFQRPVQGQTQRNWKVELKEGLSFLWRNPLLRDLAVILGIYNAAHQMMLISLVLFSQEVLGLSASGFGLLLTAAAIGGIVGGLLAEKIAHLFGDGLALRIGLITGVVQFLVIAIATGAGPIWVTFFVSEVMAMVWNSITVSLRQRHIPDDLLGRVNSAYRFFGWGMMPLGLLFGGVIVSAAEFWVPREFALRMPFFVAALTLTLATALVWPRLTNAKLKNVEFH